jgi:hypothetical protein
MMGKGKVAKASMAQPTKGPMDTSKPKGGKVEMGYAGKAKPGKKA